MDIFRNWATTGSELEESNPKSAKEGVWPGNAMRVDIPYFDTVK